MAQQEIDLTSLFQAVTTTLAENKAALNQADTYNHDHGDHMVEVFKTVTGAVKKKSNAPAAEQLAYASKALSKKSDSGSAKIYAESLSKASKVVTGQGITPDKAMPFLQTLLGGGVTPPQAPQTGAPGQTAQTQTGSDMLGSLLAGMNSGSELPTTPSSTGGADPLSSLLGGLLGGSAPQQAPQQPASGDMLSSLLGGLMGGSAPQQAPQQPAGGDMLSSLLGGLMGGSAPQQAPQQNEVGGEIVNSLLGSLMGGGTQQSSSSNGIDTMDLISMGLAFLKAKNSGKSTIEALISAVLNNSAVGQQGYRKESGGLIASTILQMLGGMAK